MLRGLYISLLLLFLASGVMGQAVTQKALRHYKGGELEKARTLIDSAVTLEEEKADPYTWQGRGFIYKDLFKAASEESERAELRREALDAYEMAIEKGAEGKMKANCRKGMRYLAQTYYNDAMGLMDTTHYSRAIQYFEQYIEISKALGDTEEDLKKDRKSFFNNLGGIYMTIYEEKKEHDKEFFERTLNTFDKVLEMDSSNYLANYNTGIMYYNRGVQISKKVDPVQMDVELDKVKKLQKKSTKNFRKALPYMKEAHEQRPRRLETLEGLHGIYYSLNEDEKSERYKELKEKVAKEKKR